jgi:hypothetical protein
MLNVPAGLHFRIQVFFCCAAEPRSFHYMQAWFGSAAIVVQEYRCLPARDIDIRVVKGDIFSAAVTVEVSTVD